jgi:hypothetical protein
MSAQEEVDSRFRGNDRHGLIFRRATVQAWRMAFRDGNKGFEMWRQCLANGVAAIAYGGMDFDLSRYPEGQPRERWLQLSAPQRYSLKRFAYKIKVGHTIYVKQGPNIVGKGRVLKGYVFHRRSPIKGEQGDRWPHLIPVDWDREFLPVTVQIGDTQLFTGRPLSQADLRKLRRARVKLETARNTVEAIEGKTFRREAEFRQRNRGLVEAKKANSGYRCEVCRINFEEYYGAVGKEFIIAHHVEPLGRRRRASRTSLDDIKLVCANCHAMIHQKSPPLLVEKLRAKLRTR